jgi:DNA-binding transcriptional MerR regulator
MKPINKKYYTLKQVSKLTDIPIHTLKFWRKEFKMHLKLNSSGRRIFEQADIDKILLIKHLRQQGKLTLSGIKRRLEEMKDVPKSKEAGKNRQSLLWIQKELLSVKNLLQQSISDK